jgi:hypothetical protein
MNKLPAKLIATALALACMGVSAAEPAKTSCVPGAQAKGTAPAGPRQTTSQDGTAAVSSVGNLAGGAGGGAAAASYAKTADPNAGMPNRISMNVTVAKQTQGATFGEKVNQGLHAAGGAVAQGASATSGTSMDCDDVADVALKHKTGQSDASAGGGAGTDATAAEKKADSAGAATSDKK